MIREAGAAADAAACAAIYAPYVRDTAITFELEPPSPVQFAHRIANAHLWLVAEEAGDVVGYAYAGAFRERAAYRFAVEVSVYLAPAAQGKGLGRRLYGELLPALAARGFRQAVAGMTVPNAASEALHTAVGFRRVGLLERVGWKLGAWHDVAYLQLGLGGTGDPAEPE